MAAHAYITRVNHGGNFCGHDPANPNLTLPKPAKTGKGGIPLVLTLCSNRLTDYFYNPGKTLPTLNLANGSSRQQRSEMREACIVVMTAMLGHTDLPSLRVGIPTRGGFMNYTVDYIAKKTGLGRKRVARALHYLKKAGLITISQARKKVGNQWIGLAAVKAVSKHLFGAFGLALMLERERKKASKRLKKKTLEWENKVLTHTEKARQRLYLGGLGKKVSTQTTPTIAKPKQATDPPDQENQRLLAAEVLKLHEANKNWTIQQCRQEAEKNLNRTR